LGHLSLLTHTCLRGDLFFQASKSFFAVDGSVSFLPAFFFFSLFRVMCSFPLFFFFLTFCFLRVEPPCGSLRRFLTSFFFCFAGLPRVRSTFFLLCPCRRFFYLSLLSVRAVGLRLRRIALLCGLSFMIFFCSHILYVRSSLFLVRCHAFKPRHFFEQPDYPSAPTDFQVVLSRPQPFFDRVFLDLSSPS